VMAIAGTLAALWIRAGELAAAPIVALAVLAGGAIGLFNGVLVAGLRLSPIVATLVLFTAGRGIAQLLSQGQIVTFESAGFEALAAGSLLFLPATAWIALAAFLACAALARASAFGLYVEALGDNPRSARIAGLPVAAVTLSAYALCAALAALAGLIVAADIKAADAASSGLYVELDAILAVAIGGTPLAGGRMRLAGSLLGALFLQMLTTAVLMHGWGLESTLILKASAVLAVCALHSPRLRRRARRKARGAPA